MLAYNQHRGGPHPCALAVVKCARVLVKGEAPPARDVQARLLIIGKFVTRILVYIWRVPGVGMQVERRIFIYAFS